MAFAPAPVTAALSRVTSHLTTVGECLRGDDPVAAARWLEQAATAVGDVVDELHAVEAVEVSDLTPHHREQVQRWADYYRAG